MNIDTEGFIYGLSTELCKQKPVHLIMFLSADSLKTNGCHQFQITAMHYAKELKGNVEKAVQTPANNLRYTGMLDVEVLQHRPWMKIVRSDKVYLFDWRYMLFFISVFVDLVPSNSRCIPHLY